MLKGLPELTSSVGVLSIFRVLEHNSISVVTCVDGEWPQVLKVVPVLTSNVGVIRITPVGKMLVGSRPQVRPSKPPMMTAAPMMAIFSSVTTRDDTLVCVAHARGVTTSRTFFFRRHPHHACREDARGLSPPGWRMSIVRGDNDHNLFSRDDTFLCATHPREVSKTRFDNLGGICVAPAG